MRWALVLLMLLMPLSGRAHVWAQAEAGIVDIAVPPIGCWWQSSTPSARVGERFLVTLTCAVLETDAARVVPDESQLAPVVVRLPPFEVVDGRRGADQHTGRRRFFQYEYQVRLIGEHRFATDAYLPAVEIAYTVETQVDGHEALQGRAQVYTMPPLPIRIQSLVTRDAVDIRSAAGSPSLAAIDAREFKANLLRIAAVALWTIAGLLAVIAAIGAARRGPVQTTRARHRLADRVVIRETGRELADVARRRQIEGWTAELAGRALTALRIGAALATGHTVSQRATSPAEPARDGQLAVTGGFPRPTTVLVSASSTAVSVAGSTPASSATEALDREGLASALAAFTAARFGREAALDAATLDEALTVGRRTVDRLAAAHTRVAEAIARLTQRVEAWRMTAWSR